jgi:hypothetical protein
LILTLTPPERASNIYRQLPFGVDKYVPKVGDEVKIAIQVEATKD